MASCSSCSVRRTVSSEPTQGGNGFIGPSEERGARDLTREKVYGLRGRNSTARRTEPAFVPVLSLRLAHFCFRVFRLVSNAIIALCVLSPPAPAAAWSQERMRARGLARGGSARFSTGTIHAASALGRGVVNGFPPRAESQASTPHKKDGALAFSSGETQQQNRPWVPRAARAGREIFLGTAVLVGSRFQD